MLTAQRHLYYAIKTATSADAYCPALGVVAQAHIVIGHLC